jgi:hypothetical protein
MGAARYQITEPNPIQIDPKRYMYDANELHIPNGRTVSITSLLAT